MIDCRTRAYPFALLALLALLAPPDLSGQDAGRWSARAHELFLLAEEALQRGEQERATVWLDEAVRLDPGSVLPRLELASALLSMQAAARAEGVLEPIEERVEEEADSLSRQASRYWRLRAAASSRLGAPEKAIGFYERSAAHDPADLGLRAQLIGMYRSAGEPDGAVRHLRAAAALVPHNPEVQLELGRGLLALSRWHEAEAAFRDAVGLEPDLSDGWHGLGVSLIAQSRYRQAEEALRRGVRLDPSAPDMHEHLGDALLGSGQAAAALRSYRRAVELSGNDRGIAEKIERARARLGS